MEMNHFDIYKELWTKSRTAFSEEHNIEFTHLKKVIEVHNIPIPDSKYLYDYRRGAIGTLTPIEGEDYIIKIDEKLSEKTKITHKWSYRDIALCYRNYLYDNQSSEEVIKSKLELLLGFQLDMQKVKYYILVDELF
ncbi:hypothetical protein EVU91_05180 [Macrococcoides bohemicum]|uniref:hypothetical protein n=1 Tax=Macrococcoides bohemicum TaxID=1903056 RepID=UPI001059CFC7|nr:hypothetical protein [Macrococcus bohemicus]TDL38300.1 hypothetical protein EVU91_05180 [Macrococcus bohemicus]